MSSSTDSIPLLFGGISKQPTHMRHPTQVQDASNVRFDVFEGAIKRPATSYLTLVTGLAEAGNYRLHTIIRDDTERYIVVYGDGVLKAFETDGTECTVNFDSDAETYFESGSATADQLRLITLLDRTEILNRTVEIAADGDVNNYTVSGALKNWDIMTSQLPEVSTYWYAENDIANYPEGYYQYQISDEDDNGFAYWTRELVKEWSEVGKRWDNNDINPMGFTVRFQRQDLTNTGLAYVNSGRTLTKTGAFTDYVFDSGDEIRINNFSNGDGYYEIASRTSDDEIVLSADGALVGDDGSCDIVGISKAYEAQANFVSTAPADMFDVAERFEDSLQTAGATDAIVQYDPDTGNKGAMRIIAPYRGTGTKVLDITAPTSGGVTDITDNNKDPFRFGAGTATDGTGSPTDATLAIEDRWDSAPAPGSQDATIDSTRMPAKMERTSLGPPVVFTVSLQDWSPRIDGTPTSNPAPDMFASERTIDDMILHRDRRWLFSRDQVLGSVSGDFNNFWIQNVDNLSDSDPIDNLIEPRGGNQADIESVIAFRDSMLITTKSSGQYEMRVGGDDVLTPTNVSFVGTTGFTTPLFVKPAQVNNFAYFISDEDCRVSLQEYFWDDVGLRNRTNDVSSHVHGLLPTSIRNVIAHEETGTVYVLGVDDSSIYVYLQEYKGSEKVQSAWTKYTFDDIYRICDIAIIDDDVIMLVESDSQYFIEKMPVVCTSSECTCSTTGVITTTTTASTATTATTASTAVTITTTTTGTTASGDTTIGSGTGAQTTVSQTSGGSGVSTIVWP